jgi:hypothetical protein
LLHGLRALSIDVKLIHSIQQRLIHVTWVLRYNTSTLA